MPRLRLVLRLSALAIQLAASSASATPMFMGLGDLPGGEFRSNAFGVSANGAVVVARSYSGSGREVFRWTEAGGMIGVGDLPGGAFGSQCTQRVYYN
jgi:hypothetical protein